MKRSYFRRPEEIPEGQQKWCRCVLHVMAQQTPDCLKDKARHYRVRGRSCYNPYAVCTASVGVWGDRVCLPYYDLDHIPPNEQRALELYEGKNLSSLKQSQQKLRRWYLKK